MPDLSDYIPDTSATVVPSPSLADYQPDAPPHKFSVGSADDVVPQTPQLATTAQLSPEQFRQYQQDVQTTPLDPNFHEQSTGRRIAGAALAPFSGLAAFGLNQVAGKVGDIAGPGAEDAINRIAHDTRAYTQNTQTGVSSGLTQQGTGLATLLGGPGAIAASAANTTAGGLYDAVDTANQGTPVDDHFVLNALAKGGTEYAFNTLMQQGITSDAAKAMIAKVAPYIGELPATLASRFAAGAGLMGSQNEIQNRIAGRPLGTGSINSMLQGGLMESGAGGLHDLFQPVESKAAPATEATPAAPPPEPSDNLKDQAAATQAETPPQSTGAAEVQPTQESALTNPDRFNQVADTSAPVTQRTGLDDLLAQGNKLHEEMTGPVPPKAAEPEQEPSNNSGGSASSKVSSLLSDESGGAKVPEALSTFADRVVAPAADEVKKSALASWDNVNRFLGTGIESDEAKRVGQDLRTSWAQQDLDRIRTQQQLAPFRAKAETMTPDQKVNMVDEISHGGKTSDPDMQGFADWHSQRTAEQTARAKAAGINTDNWDSGEDWFGRMFKFPDSGNGGGSIAGSEGYLKGQKFDTYKEALGAVQAAGGDARYSNPVDTALAKDMEINKSLSAREIFNKEIDRGTIEPLKAGESLPEGKQFIDDRLARKMTKAQMWIDPDTGKPAMRPAPRMIADKGIADKLNQIIAPGASSSVPILKQIAQVKRGATAMNFALSAFHIPMEAVGNASIRIGKAIENLVHGEPVRALKNVGGAFTGSLFEGKALRDQAKNAASNPGLEPIVQASVKAGQKFGVPSALEPSAWEKGGQAFKEGDPISGVMNRIGSVLNTPNRAIMDSYVPTVKAGAMGAWAQDLIRRGLPPEELNRQLSQAGDNIDNVLGQVNRPNQFQHKAVTDLLDTVFPAPKFSEGAIRYGGSLARDSVAAMKDLAAGKSPTVTPAMYTFLGLATTMASMGAATQLAYTTATTGKPIMPTNLKDLFYPQTGRKNQDGTPERISLPNPMSFIMSSMTEGPMKAIANRVSPLWRSAMDVINNSDYRNVKVREGGIGQQIEQSAAHIGKSLVPFSMQNMLEKPAGGEQSPDLKALGFLGVRKAPSVAMHSDAENALNDLSDQHPRTQEQAAKSDTLKSLLGEAKNHDPNFAKDARTAYTNHTIAPTDLANAMRKGGPENFATRIKNTNLAPDDLMQVWAKMTPDEKKQTYGPVYRKIAKAPGDNTANLKRIAEDLKEGN